MQKLKNYFCYTLDNKYGCSPDGLGPAGILLEVKTRAVGSTGPITSLENFPQYYIQCQLQMLCTDAFCNHTTLKQILQSVSWFNRAIH